MHSLEATAAAVNQVLRRLKLRKKFEQGQLAEKWRGTENGMKLVQAQGIEQASCRKTLKR